MSVAMNCSFFSRADRGRLTNGHFTATYLRRSEAKVTLSILARATVALY